MKIKRMSSVNLSKIELQEIIEESIKKEIDKPEIFNVQFRWSSDEVSIVFSETKPDEEKVTIKEPEVIGKPEIKEPVKFGSTSAFEVNKTKEALKVSVPVSQPFTPISK